MSISGKEAGCAVFIDRQLAGDYGNAASAVPAKDVAEERQLLKLPPH